MNNGVILYSFIFFQILPNTSTASSISPNQNPPNPIRTASKLPPLLSNHSNYIVEFSLGINDVLHRGSSRSILKETIKSSIKILMVSPVTYILPYNKFVDTKIMEEVYTELVSEGATK